MKNKGWNIEAAKKWTNSNIDGIAYIKGFENVIIHPSCVNIIEEFRRFSFKIDKKTNEILPIVLDDYDHGIDALRYSLNSLIQHNITIYDDGVL